MDTREWKKFYNLRAWLNIEHKCEATFSHFIALQDEHYKSFDHDRATTLFYNASIIQDIKQKLYWTTLPTQNQTEPWILHIGWSIVMQFYQKLKHLFMKMKVERHQSITSF